MHQRKGRLRAALARLGLGESAWEKADDDADWEHDFGLVYRRVN